MSNQISTALVEGYRANIQLLSQQRGSRLQGTVNMESQNSEREFYDRVGAVDAVEITTRHSDTPQIDTPHDRRALTLRDFDWADLIDRPDKLRMLADPSSAYVVNAVNSLGRKKDDLIIAAATGSAWTGKEGTTEVALPAAQTIVHGSVNLTVAKLRTARKKLLEAEAVDKDEEITIVVTADQIDALLGDTNVTSTDFNTVRALVDGNVDSFMGFTFVRTERLLKVGTTRSVICYPRSAITMGMADEISVEVDVLPTKRYSVQVYAKGSFNATRMEEVKVVEIECTEA